MEGGRDGGVARAAAALERRRWRRRRGGGGEEGEEESDGSSGGGLELSLRLRTGDGTPAAVAVAAPAAMEEEQRRRQAADRPEEAASRRNNMTIFYNGRVCAVDVTEVQARAIISMANEEILQADHRRQQLQRDQQESDSGSSTAAMARRRARDGLARPPVPAADGAGRQGFAAPVVDQAVTGLSMKRSLQRFLQKRQARTAAAVAPPYAAAGLHAQAMRH